MKPNAKAEFNPDPQYIKELIGSAGLEQKPLAAILGVNDRTLRRWLSGDREIPYTAQFALEALILSPD